MIRRLMLQQGADTRPLCKINSKLISLKVNIKIFPQLQKTCVCDKINRRG